MGLFDFIGDIFGGGGKRDAVKTTSNDIRQLPDYAEATGARQNWYDTLQKWSTQPGYGAISPDFNAIWDNARSRVQRYFAGGPEGPGVNAKIKANNARRGVADNPASDAMMQRSSFQQGNMLQDMAVKQAIEEANLGESGRKTWLGSIQNLAGLKPSFQDFGSTTETQYDQPDVAAQGIQGLLGNIAGTGSSGFEGLDQILGMFGMGGQGGDSGIGDIAGSVDEQPDSGGFDWKELLKLAGPLLMAAI